MTKVQCEWLGCKHNIKSYCQRDEIKLSFVEVKTTIVRTTQGISSSDCHVDEKLNIEDWLLCDNYKIKTR